MDDLLLVVTGGVKALGDGRVGGYLVRFTDQNTPDLEGEYFTRDTDFDIEDGDPTTVYYHHGKDAVLKNRKLGRGSMTIDNVGVWVEAQLKMRDDYERAVYAMAEEKKLGWSSGAPPHLVERVKQSNGARWLKSWPLGKDASLTFAPAAGPELTTVTTIKSLSTLSELADLLPEVAEDATADSGAAKTTPIISIEDNTMSDTPTADAVSRAEFEAIKAANDTISNQLNELLSKLTSSPALKQAGYIAPDSEKDHAGVKSLGDFLIAVQRGNSRRLASVYKATKDMAEEGGATGGYLVPPEYATELLRVNAQQSPILSRVRRVTVGVDSGYYPVLDQFVAPTAGSGNTGFAGGISAATTAEGGTLTETQATFEQLAWRVSKIGGYAEVTNELVADSPQAIEALIGDLFRIAVNGKLERHILRGSGAGEPLGILNANVAVGVTTTNDNVFAPADALKMLSRFQPVSSSQPVWITHRSVIPDFSGFTSSAADLVNYNNPLNGTLLGYPIIYSEHMPQANGDDVLLADLGAYLLFERQGLMIDYSEHAAFTSDKGTWRFKTRVDGKPWMSAPITLADPTGSYTVSPFVYHND